MSIDGFMGGRRDLYLVLADAGVSIEKAGPDGDILVRLQGGESILAKMGDDSTAVLARLLKANSDMILSHLAARIVEARSMDQENRKSCQSEKPVTIRDIGFAHRLPGLPVSLRVNNHKEQCDCGVEVDVRLDWAGRSAGRVGGLRWAEARMGSHLRDVLSELLNSCAPMIIDAMIDRVIEAERRRMGTRTSVRPCGAAAKPLEASPVQSVRVTMEKFEDALTG
jgi:hypothetical protein